MNANGQAIQQTLPDNDAYLFRKQTDEEIGRELTYNGRKEQ